MSNLERAVYRYFRGDDCGKRTALRLVAKELRPPKVKPIFAYRGGSHPDGLAKALACRLPGCCLFCEAKLTGQHRSVCGAPECRSAYDRAYARDRRNNED